MQIKYIYIKKENARSDIAIYCIWIYGLCNNFGRHETKSEPMGVEVNSTPERLNFIVRFSTNVFYEKCKQIQFLLAAIFVYTLIAEILHT